MRSCNRRGNGRNSTAKGRYEQSDGRQALRGERPNGLIPCSPFTNTGLYRWLNAPAPASFPIL